MIFSGKKRRRKKGVLGILGPPYCVQVQAIDTSPFGAGSRKQKRLGAAIASVKKFIVSCMWDFLVVTQIYQSFQSN